MTDQTATLDALSSADKEALEDVTRRWADHAALDEGDVTLLLRLARRSAVAPASPTAPQGGSVPDGWTLGDLHAANIARQAEWCPDQVPDLSFRGNELGGECGEAQNVIKKLERERQGWRGPRATLGDLAQELADVVICADLCAVTAGIDLYAAVQEKFNATSDKVGLSTKLTPQPPAPAAERATDAVVSALEKIANLSPEPDDKDWRNEWMEPAGYRLFGWDGEIHEISVDTSNHGDIESWAHEKGLHAAAVIARAALATLATNPSPGAIGGTIHQIVDALLAEWRENKKGSLPSEYEYGYEAAFRHIIYRANKLGACRASQEKAQIEGSQALRDVIAERRRQVEAEGWTPEHDDAHAHGELALAAGCYARAAGIPGSYEPGTGHRAAGSARLACPDDWPWERARWRPSSYRGDLVKAVALGIAAIEAFDRKSAPASSGDEGEAA